MWILPLRSNPRGRSLFCFPYAGGSAAVFRTWAAGLPQVDVRPVQLPGRGGRLRETPFTRIRELAAAACDGLLPHLGEPFAFFGHSFGGLVAFEVARELRRRGGPEPFHMFVSARRGPRSPDPAVPLHRLPDARFLEEVQGRYGAIPQAILQEPELLALLLPTLRADLEAVETYAYVAEPPLRVPISAFGAVHDPWATRDDLAAWQHETDEAFSLTRFPGGHFYLEESEASLLAEIRARLGSAAGDLSLAANA
jgi:medium-chain acyl-[acyl-carrier-protein] hydrolase